MRANPVTAYLLLGSNVGGRRRYLNRARSAVKRWAQTKIRRASTVWPTSPWGQQRQREFLNQTLEVETRLDPLPFLIWAKKTEVELGRRHRRRWGPREIDIDILLYGQEVFKHPFLTIPHPGLTVRPFALGPLSEMAPRLVHPVVRSTMKALYEQIK